MKRDGARVPAPSEPAGHSVPCRWHLVSSPASASITREPQGTASDVDGGITPRLRQLVVLPKLSSLYIILTDMKSQMRTLLFIFQVRKLRYKLGTRCIGVPLLLSCWARTRPQDHPAHRPALRSLQYTAVIVLAPYSCFPKTSWWDNIFSISQLSFFF